MNKKEASTSSNIRTRKRASIFRYDPKTSEDMSNLESAVRNNAADRARNSETYSLMSSQRRSDASRGKPHFYLRDGQDEMEN